MTATLFGELFHTGIVVDDLESAMGELAGAVGVSWRAPISGTRRMWTPDGERDYEFAAVYSRDGPPYLELVRAAPNTIWAHAGAHHLGFWSDDVEVGARALDHAGMERLVAIRDADSGVLLATYHRSGSGTYLELISSTSRERLVGTS